MVRTNTRSSTIPNNFLAPSSGAKTSVASGSQSSGNTVKKAISETDPNAVNTNDADGIAEGANDADREISADAKTADENEQLRNEQSFKRIASRRKGKARGKKTNEATSKTENADDAFAQAGAKKPSEENKHKQTNSPLARAVSEITEQAKEPVTQQANTNEPARSDTNTERGLARYQTVSGDVNADLQSKGINTNPALVDGAGSTASTSPLAKPTLGIAADKGVVAGGADLTAPVLAAAPAAVNNGGVDAVNTGPGQVATGAVGQQGSIVGNSGASLDAAGSGEGTLPTISETLVEEKTDEVVRDANVTDKLLIGEI